MLCVAFLINPYQNYYLVINRLSFVHKTTNCMHQTWPTQGTKHPAIWYVHSRRLPRLPWHRVPRQLWEFFRLTLKINGQYQCHHFNKRYLLSNTSLMTFCFQQDRALARHACNAAKLQGRVAWSLNFTSSNMAFNFVSAQRWNPLIMRSPWHSRWKLSQELKGNII